MMDVFNMYQARLSTSANKNKTVSLPSIVRVVLRYSNEWAVSWSIYCPPVG